MVRLVLVMLKLDGHTVKGVPNVEHCVEGKRQGTAAVILFFVIERNLDIRNWVNGSLSRSTEYSDLTAFLQDLESCANLYK